MPKKRLTYEQLKQRHAEGKDFWKLGNNVLGPMSDRWLRIADNLEKQGNQALANKVRDYGNTFHFLIQMPEEHLTVQVREGFENALDDMASFSDFLEERSPRNGPTNYQRILEQYRALDVQDGFDPENGQNGFKRDIQRISDTGECDVPVDDLHREADVNLHPEKKAALTTELQEFKENPASKIAARLFLDARKEVRDARKANNTWKMWDEEDDLDRMAHTGKDNLYRQIDDYFNATKTAISQGNYGVNNVNISLGQLLPKLNNVESYSDSPEGQRYAIRELTPYVQKFLEANEKLKATEHAQFTQTWNPAPDPEGDAYYEELFNDNDYKVIDSFVEEDEKPFRFPQDVPYENTAAHLAGEIRESGDRWEVTGTIGQLRSIQNTFKTMADDNGEKKITASHGNYGPFRTLEVAARNLVNAELNLAKNYKDHNDPDSRVLLTEAEQALKDLEKSVNTFQKEHADLAAEYDFDEKATPLLHAIGHMNVSGAPVLDTYYMSDKQKEQAIFLNQQGRLNKDDEKLANKLAEDKEKIIVAEPEPEKPAPFLNTTADKKGRTWLGYMEHHQQWPVPKGKELEYLTKALVGAQMSVRKRPFSVDLARGYAKGVMEYDAVQQIAKSPERLRRIMQSNDPEYLREIATHAVHPFFAKKDKQMEVLKNLKELHRHMDRPEGHSKQWTKLVNGIAAIDLEDPNLDPERKLIEVMGNCKDYTKSYFNSKKSMRLNPTVMNCFGQCLDVMSELAATSDFANDAVKTVFQNADKQRNKTGLGELNKTNFGLHKILEHENEGRLNDPTAAGKDPFEEHNKQSEDIKINQNIITF